MAGRQQNFHGLAPGGALDPPDPNEKKIFVGGISWDTSEVDLQMYFGQYGDVKHVQIKYDPVTGQSRGFAFVEFLQSGVICEVLKNKKHLVKNKTVEVKRAVSRENKKIFVGGVSNDYPEEGIRQYFQQFGEIDEIELPVDKQSNRRRNFIFVIFKDEDGTNKACEQQKHLIGDRYCDVKKATPMRTVNGQPGMASGGFPPGVSQPSTGNPYQDWYQAWYNYYYYYASSGDYSQQQQQQAAVQAAAGQNHSANFDWSNYGYGYPGWQSYSQAE